jgi:hypothetical protein
MIFPMKILRYQTLSILNSILNLQNNNLISNNQILGSPTLSIILPTQYDTPIYQSPADIRDIIPKGIRAEIVVIQYNHDTGETATNKFSKGAEMADKEHKNIHDEFDHNVNSIKVKVGFISAILKGIQLSTGQFIFVMDADLPYPKRVTSKIITELIKYPNSIIVASRYTKGASMQNLPLLRRLISKRQGPSLDMGEHN